MPLINMDYTEVLSEISVDDYHFKVTCNPVLSGSCILWFRDARIAHAFEALGQFSYFDKRSILFFITRYATSADLRQEIDNRRFERKVGGLAPHFFRHIEQLSLRDKELAYRRLFNLDAEIDPDCLKARRRIMTKQFHPDVGGNDYAMAMINEAYDFLVHRAAN